MTIGHHLCGYNRRTEVLERDIQVPISSLGYVADVAGVNREEDPDVIGAYPIAQERLGQLDDFLTEMWDYGNYDWALQAFEDAGATSFQSNEAAAD
jgi:hypothetical protein